MRFQATLISEEKSKLTDVVLSLLESLLGKGHALWMSNLCRAAAVAKLVVLGL